MATAKKAAPAGSEETAPAVVTEGNGIGPVESDEERMARLREEMRAVKEEMKGDTDTQSDVRLPSMELIQATKIPEIEGAMPGRFHHTGQDLIVQEFGLVIGKTLKTRTRFGPELGQPPLCWSNDAKNGYGEPGDDLSSRGDLGGGACSVCPEGFIRNPVTGERGTCKLQYNYVGYLVEIDGEPIETGNLPIGIQMKSTSAKTALRLNAMLMDLEFPWSRIVRFGSVKETNDYGEYRVWTMRGGPDADFELQVKAMQVAKELTQAQKDRRMIALGGSDQAASSSSGDKEKDPEGDEIPF